MNKASQRMIALLTSAPLRAIYAALWTQLIVVALLQSSSEPVIGPAAPPGPPSLERELYLTAGHLVGFGVLTLLIWWALIPHFRPGWSQGISAAVALIIGFSTELAQTGIPDRSASWFDAVVNTVVVLATAAVIRRYSSSDSLFG